MVIRADIMQQPWSEEYYLIEGNNAWFGGYRFFTDELFGAPRAVLFDPPILINQTGEVTVSAEVEHDSVVITEEQTWVISAEEGVLVDGRSVDRNPLEVMLVSDTGEEHLWHLSQTRVLSERWIASGEVSVKSLRRDHYSELEPPDDDPFPFESGDEWLETALIIEGASW